MKYLGCQFDEHTSGSRGVIFYIREYKAAGHMAPLDGVKLIRVKSSQSKERTDPGFPHGTSSERLLISAAPYYLMVRSLHSFFVYSNLWVCQEVQGQGPDGRHLHQLHEKEIGVEKLTGNGTARVL